MKYILLGLLIYAGVQEKEQPRPAQLPVVTEAKPSLAPSGPPVGNYKEITEQVAADSEQQKVRDKMTAPELTAAYDKFLTELIPSYNFIRTRVQWRVMGGHVLIGAHPFFSRYSFSSGNLAGWVSHWTRQHCVALKAAKIGYVGVAGSDTGYSIENDTTFRVKDVCP